VVEFEPSILKKRKNRFDSGIKIDPFQHSHALPTESEDKFEENGGPDIAEESSVLQHHHQPYVSLTPTKASPSQQAAPRILQMAMRQLQQQGECSCTDGVVSCGDYCRFLPPHKQRALIKEILRKEAKQNGHNDFLRNRANSGKPGEKKYLISSNWWRVWSDFVNLGEGTNLKVGLKKKHLRAY